MKIIYKNKHWILSEDYNIDKILYLLIDRPTHIDCNDFVWLNKKEQPHREYDLPAFIFNNGYVSWLHNNKYHRENNKPAVIHPNSYKQYWLNNYFIK